jgi:hypothetical protein
MSNNVNEYINNLFNKDKIEKKNQLLKEQQELIDKYNSNSMDKNNNFYNNYFDNINGIIYDILFKKTIIKNDRLLYIGITLIFISFFYLIYRILNIYYLNIKI